MNTSNFLGMGNGYWINWIFGLIFLAVIIGMVIKIVNQKNRLNHPDNISALDILKHRYAKGEISKTEFEEKKKGLK